jgi:hypothetical protein
MSESPSLPDLVFSLYCASSGRFFHAYTAMEHELNLAIFAAVTRMTKRQKRKEVLLAVLGGQRMSPAKDTIKRLLRATKANPKRLRFVDCLFAQLGELQFFRDRLAHNLTVLTEEEPHLFMNMNFAGIRELEKFEDIVFDVDALDAATHDLHTMRLLVATFFNHYVRDGSAAVPRLPTWRYKPSMLTRDRPLSRGNRKRRKHRPQSSEA